MLDMGDINELKPDWTHRRKIIKCMTYALAGMVLVSLIASIALAAFSKFGLYISIFLTVFVTLCFIVILGIIGSYIFGARWENRDFLSILPGIMPDFSGGNSNNNNYQHRYEDPDDRIPPSS